MNFNIHTKETDPLHPDPELSPYQPILETPQSFRSLLDLAWQLMKAEKEKIIKIFMLVYIPATLFSNSLGRFDGLFSTDWLLDIVIFLISICIITVAYVSLIHLTHSVVHNVKISWQEAVNVSYQRFGISLANSALVTLYTVLWSILLIIPGLIAMSRYIFVLQATVIKGLKGNEAINYSKTLVKGRLPQFFALFMTYIVLNLALDLLMVQIFTFTMPFIGPFAINVLAGLIAGLVEIVFTIFSTLLFINLDFTSNEPTSE